MGTLTLLVSLKLSGGPIKKKANIKPLLVSLSGALCLGRRKLFCWSSPISAPIWQVEMKHGQASSEKMEVDPNPSLDKHSPLLDIICGLLIYIFWPPKRDIQGAPSHFYTLTHTPSCTHIYICTLTALYTHTFPCTLSHFHTHTDYRKATPMPKPYDTSKSNNDQPDTPTQKCPI